MGEESQSDYDAIVFDIDGTLWNASAASATGWTNGLRSLGVERRITAEEIESVAGRPYEECVDILLPGLRRRFPALSARLGESEREAVLAKAGVLYDGVREGIRTLSRAYRIFIVSNCQSWYLDIFLRFSGIGPALAGCDCNGDSGLPKDKMLRNLKATYRFQKPVYVGDTEGDGKAAASAGFPFIHVRYGFGTASECLRAFDTFDDLVRYLDA